MSESGSKVFLEGDSDIKLSRERFSLMSSRSKVNNLPRAEAYGQKSQEEKLAASQQLVSVAIAHAALEATQDLEALLGTMEGEPVYEFYPLGRRFIGMANTRRYYEHFLREVQPRIITYTALSESIGAAGVVQEFSVTVGHQGEDQPTEHRIMAILTFGNARLSGERMFSDDKFFKLLVGPLWDALEPI